LKRRRQSSRKGFSINRRKNASDCLSGLSLFALLTLCGCLALSSQQLGSPSQTKISLTSPATPLPSETTRQAVQTLLTPSWWQPKTGSSFEWDLGHPVDTSYAVEVYDIDLFDNDAGVVQVLHAQGSKVICYLSVGSFEDWRPDAYLFPPEIIGRDYAGWPGEKWLDIRSPVVRQVMAGRLDQCAAKGFDGVEPDNMWIDEDTGFPITDADALDYTLWLAAEAHMRGLSIGQKNAPEMTADLVGKFDWALVEQCFADGFCDALSAYVDEGKAVFSVEYTDQTTLGEFRDDICPEAARMGFTAILKHPELDGFREACAWP
jgi:hypothetical protein